MSRSAISEARAKLASSAIKRGSPCTRTASKSARTRATISIRAVRRPGQRRRLVKNRTRGCGGLLGVRPRAAAPTPGEMRADRMGMPRSPEHRAWLPRYAASRASRRAAHNASSTSRPSAPTSVLKLESPARIGGSCTTCRAADGFELRQRLAARNEGYGEPLARHAVDQMMRAPQMPDAEQVLHVEQDGSGHRALRQVIGYAAFAGRRLWMIAPIRAAATGRSCSASTRRRAAVP